MAYSFECNATTCRGITSSSGDLNGPEKAVDGLKPAAGDKSPGVFISSLLSRTDQNVTLSIDLNETMLISKVLVYIRRKCCGNLTYEFRAGGAAVDNSSRSAMIGFNNVIHRELSYNQTDDVISISVSTSRAPTARYVSIRGIPINATTTVFPMFVEIVEVEVYGSPADEAQIVCTGYRAVTY
ncbi:hypothetical protein PLESTB_000404900 [Pleodorina starrii]|uniref:Uncharacterized protein n=1 Tax=Pleodorina starrii TaxID=330485 RepID=A0A9W6BFJ3_9CHLO|nr:hypothetical protein PLESTB_000404900 [Pleodorina starrii]